MNFLPLSPFSDRRLALAVELRDALSRQKVTHQVLLIDEDGDGGVPFHSYSAGHFVQLAVPGAAARQRPYRLRVEDPARRYVPRRFVIPPAPQAADQAAHVRRPLLFPGPAYPVGPGATGLRGSVRGTDGKPRPFCRVAATLPDGKTRVWTQGDGRGEFLLLLGPGSAAGGALQPIPLQITIYTPDADPADPAAGRALPRREPLTAPDGAPDPDGAGESVAGFTQARPDTTQIALRPGQLQAQAFTLS